MPSRKGLLVTPQGIYPGEIVLKDREMLFITNDSVPTAAFGIVVFGETQKTMPVDVVSFERGENTCTFRFARKKHNSMVETFKKPIKPYTMQHHIHYPVPLQVLNQFVKFGVLERIVSDTILLCPECNGLHTVRPGCPKCGSSNLHKDILYHHYACGNVDKAENFRNPNGSVNCLKCGKTNLIVNIDYDFSTGLIHCADCDWTGNGAKLVGECLSCETRFLVAEAQQTQLWTFTLLDKATTNDTRNRLLA